MSTSTSQYQLDESLPMYAEGVSPVESSQVSFEQEQFDSISVNWFGDSEQSYTELMRQVASAATIATERRTIEADAQLALEEESERGVEAAFRRIESTQQHYVRACRTVLTAYARRKASQGTTSLRALVLGGGGPSMGQNTSFHRASTSDFVADVELSLKKHRKELGRNLVCCLGAEFCRRGIYPLSQYFAKFQSSSQR